MVTKKQLMNMISNFLDSKKYKGMIIPSGVSSIEIIEIMTPIVMTKITKNTTNHIEIFERYLAIAINIAIKKKEYNKLNGNKIVSPEWSIPAPASASRFLPSAELNDIYGRTYSDNTSKLTYWANVESNPLNIKKDLKYYLWMTENIIKPLAQYYYDGDETKITCINTNFKNELVKGITLEFNNVKTSKILNDLSNKFIDGVIFGVCFPIDASIFFSSPIYGIPSLLGIIMDNSVYGLTVR